MMTYHARSVSIWRLCVTAFIFAMLIDASSAASAGGTVSSSLPKQPDPGARYLIYMHGSYLEKRRNLEIYQLPEILQALAAAGLNVIGEIRNPLKGREVAQYAGRIKAQVNALIAAGVPASSITVAGHSKGGMIALRSSAAIRNGKVRFAVLAGCGFVAPYARSYKRFVRKRAARMRGTFLVMWEASDDEFADCDVALRAAGVPYRNVRLTGGGGHRLFYRAHETWIRLLADFALGKSRD